MNVNRVLQVGAHEELMLAYFSNFSDSALVFDYVLRRNGVDFRYKNDPLFKGKLFYVTPLQVSFFRWMIELRHVVKLGRYRVMHLHLGWANIFGIISCLGLPVRIISHNHSFYKSSSLCRKLLRYPIKYFINELSWMCLGCSRESANEMFYSKNSRVLKNAIDYERFYHDQNSRDRLRAQLGFVRDQFVFVHVGNFYEPKNHLFLIVLFKAIRAVHHSAKLLLVGDDYGSRDSVAKAVKEFNLQSHVVFMGVRKDIPDILSASDVFLFPSLFEGFGIALLEAQVNGLPCIFSNRIPADAVISPQYSFACGLSIHDIDLWIEAVEKCIGLGFDCASRSHRSLNADKTFDVKAVASELEDIYLTAFSD